MQLALSEVKSRNAFSIVITNCEFLLDKQKVDMVIPIADIKVKFMFFDYYIIKNYLLILLVLQKNLYEIKNDVKLILIIK